jgi:hypothetical protein
MRKFTLLLLFIPLGIFAQTSEFHYTYDAAGNREQRTHVQLKPNNPQGDNTNTATYEDAVAGLQVSLYPNP